LNAAFLVYKRRKNDSFKKNARVALNIQVSVVRAAKKRFGMARVTSALRSVLARIQALSACRLHTMGDKHLARGLSTSRMKPRQIRTTRTG